MSQSYNVIYHLDFINQSREIRDKKPSIEPALVTALQEIASNPLPGSMQEISIPHLVGVIHKKHVGGRKGHRLIYLLPIGSNIVIPVFLSPTTKPPFDYDQVNWQEICENLYQDYVSMNYQAFSNWKI